LSFSHTIQPLAHTVTQLTLVVSPRRTALHCSPPPTLAQHVAARVSADRLKVMQDAAAFNQVTRAII
jgi:hypothetical protein